MSEFKFKNVKYSKVDYHDDLTNNHSSEANKTNTFNKEDNSIKKVGFFDTLFSKKEKTITNKDPNINSNIKKNVTPKGGLSKKALKTLILVIVLVAIIGICTAVILIVLNSL